MRCHGKRLHKQNTHHHDWDNPNNSTQPNNRYDQDSQPKRGRHQRRRRTRRRRYATHLLSTYRQLNLRCTIATTSSAHVQKAATRVCHDTLTLSATPLLYDTDARPLSLFCAARDLSGTPCLIHLFALTEFLREPGRGHGTSTLALGAIQRFVYRGLTERVIIVIVIVERRYSNALVTAVIAAVSD